MKYSELKNGEIYTVVYTGGIHYIMEAGTGHNIQDETSFYKGGDFRRQKDGYEIATFEKAQWIRECIKQDRFIPFREIIIKNETYEIY